MARTAEGRALTQRHRREQLALRAASLRELQKLWQAFDPTSIRSYSSFVTAALPLITDSHRRSAAIGAAYYNAFRFAEGVGGEIRTALPQALARDVVVTNLRATGLQGTMRGIRSGMSPQAAARHGFVQASGSTGRMILLGGNDAIIGSTRNDGMAQGWARVTSGNPCEFCAMVASRGPVFRSEGTADFESHDHCACTVEPHYEGSAWPGKARQFREMWDSATEGLSGRDAINAFRRRLKQTQGG